jgi:hypothetical protein
MRKLYPWDRSLDGYLWETPGSSAGDSGAGGTGTGTPGGGSPTSGTTDPAAGGSPASTGTGQSGDNNTPGPVDYARFKEVNDKYAKLTWAESHDQNEVDQATRLYRWFDTDPEGAYEYLTGVMRRQGHLKAPAQPASQVPQGADPRLFDRNTGKPLPDIIIQETGQRLYSADQQEKLNEWYENRIDTRLKPLEERTQATLADQQARQNARAEIQDAERNWPHFNDFAEAIFGELQKDRRLSLEGAYRRVVVPKIKELERTAVIQEVRGKANAGTSNPGTGSPAGGVDESKLSLKELFKREMSKRGMGT